MAYISCEPSDRSGNLSAGDTVWLAANVQPHAIVLYSEYAATCNFSPTGGFQYLPMYNYEEYRFLEGNLERSTEEQTAISENEHIGGSELFDGCSECCGE